jgi:hypothetical protein
LLLALKRSQKAYCIIRKGNSLIESITGTKGSSANISTREDPLILSAIRAVPEPKIITPL